VKKLVSEITIGNFKLNYVTNLSIQSSWDTFTDTATISFPNKFRDKNGRTIIAGADNVFKRGDAVEIKVGYLPNLTSKFKGFISKVIPDSPLVLSCEDRMWLLKQENVASKTFINKTIKDVVDFLVLTPFPDFVIEYDDPTAKIGNLQIDNSAFINIVGIFDVLKKNFGFHIYFTDEKLQVRAVNSILALSNPVHRLGFQNNIINSNLEFIRDDDTKRIIKFESKQTDNSVIILFGFKKNGEITITETPQKGEIVNSWKVPEQDKAAIEKLMRQSIDKFIFEGYFGDFTTFLEPSVEHSDRIDLIDLKFTERQGRYLIKKVETSFGINGGRQIINLQNKISA